MPWRIGVSPYINVRPLIEGLADDPEIELVIASPARLADLLRLRGLDAGLVSSTEYFLGDYEIIAGAAISADECGSDAMLFGNVPLENMRSIALDSASRSTNLLVRLLMQWYRPGVVISYHIRPPDVHRSLNEFDGCVIIGDLALRECPEAEYEYNLAEMWRKEKGLPVVLTLWLQHTDVDPELAKRIRAAADRGRAGLDRIIARVAREKKLDESKLAQYYKCSLDYDWTDRHVNSLEVLGQELNNLGLIKDYKPVRFAAE